MRHDASAGGTVTVRWKASLAVEHMQVHVQHDGTDGGGLEYDPETYVSSTRVNCFTDRQQDTEIARTGTNNYAVWMIPVVRQGDGSFIKYDGTQGEDHMAFQLIAIGGGAVGPAGPAGPPGGPQGEQGEQGADGSDGSDGADGAQGAAGVAGAAGADGAQGEQGDAGAAGNDGAAGADGPEGPQGPAGEAGADGEQGEPGPAGGPQGEQGIQGEAGVAGEAGAQGEAGVSGSTTSDAQRTEQLAFTAVPSTTSEERQQTAVAADPVTVHFGSGEPELLTVVAWREYVYD